MTNSGNNLPTPTGHVSNVPFNIKSRSKGLILQLRSTTPSCIGLAVSGKGICSEVRSLINPQIAGPSIRRGEPLIFVLDSLDQIGKRLGSIHATGASAYLDDLSSDRPLSSISGFEEPSVRTESAK